MHHRHNQSSAWVTSSARAWRVSRRTVREYPRLARERFPMRQHPHAMPPGPLHHLVFGLVIVSPVKEPGGLMPPGHVSSSSLAVSWPPPHRGRAILQAVLSIHTHAVVRGARRGRRRLREPSQEPIGAAVAAHAVAKAIEVDDERLHDVAEVAAASGAGERGRGVGIHDCAIPSTTSWADGRSPT